MTDDREQPDADERDDDEHPLESPETLLEPRDLGVGEEEDRAPQPGLTPATPHGR